MFLWDWFTGVLKGLGLMNKSGKAFNVNHILMPWLTPLTGIFTFYIKNIIYITCLNAIPFENNILPQ